MGPGQRTPSHAQRGRARGRGAGGFAAVSSGLGGVYPEGLYVGQVVSLGADPMGLVQEIVIRPGARFHSLEELFILRPTP